MQNTIVHDEGATSLEGAVGKVKLSSSLIKLGLDIHAKQYVVVAQYDQWLPKAARRFWPGEFVPWVKWLLRQGHTVHVVYEACGFGFGLYRQLRAAGAHCYVIAPRKLDEQRTGVKTDPRDATILCQRLSRYVEGNTRELAVIRVPSQEEEQARHVTRQREQLVHHRQKLEAQFAHQSGFASAGSLVEEANLEPLRQILATVDDSTTGVLSPGAFEFAGAN